MSYVEGLTTKSALNDDELPSDSWNVFVLIFPSPPYTKGILVFLAMWHLVLGPEAFL